MLFLYSKKWAKMPFHQALAHFKRICICISNSVRPFGFADYTLLGFPQGICNRPTCHSTIPPQPTALHIFFVLPFDLSSLTWWKISMNILVLWRPPCIFNGDWYCGGKGQWVIYYWSQASASLDILPWEYKRMWMDDPSHFLHLEELNRSHMVDQKYHNSRNTHSAFSGWGALFQGELGMFCLWSTV